MKQKQTAKEKQERIILSIDRAYNPARQQALSLPTIEYPDRCI